MTYYKSEDIHDAVVRLQRSLSLLGSRQDVIKDTHGNVSFMFKEGNIVIKPSGVDYNSIMEVDICHLEKDDTGSYVQKDAFLMKPSVDLVHHLSIYERHPWVKAICHTHSPYVVAFAVRHADMLCLTTEQADYFGGHVFCLRYASLDKWGEEVTIDKNDKAVILSNHGALTFSDDPVKAVKLAINLENIAMKNYLAHTLNVWSNVNCLTDSEANKWFERYNNVYGQR